MKKIFLMTILLGAFFVAGPGTPDVAAFSGFFTDPTAGGCSGCHTDDTGSRFCAACHAHGTHSSSAKNDININATTDKTSYAPGETITVSVTGGYRDGWVRVNLYDGDPASGGTLIDRSSGPCNDPSLPDNGCGSGAAFPGPITFMVQAPMVPGTYQWFASWYGNRYDLNQEGGTTFFGPGWRPDPNNPNHGEEVVPIQAFDVAAANLCAGQVCDDGNICTDDACDPGTGNCVFTNNSAPCDDGNACTSGDTCSNGACQAGSPQNCDDGNACTSDSCVSPVGCVNTPVQCAPQEFCDPADGQCKVADLCLGISCDDGNPCTDDACNPATGACVSTPNTAPCDDGDACTSGDTCANGACLSGGAAQCDDGNLCTTDSCDSAAGCVNTAVPCATGEVCDPADGACKAGDACDQVQQMVEAACPVDGDYKNHGQYVRCVAHILSGQVEGQVIDRDCAHDIIKDAAHSHVGKKRKHDSGDDDGDGESPPQNGNDAFGAALYADNCASCHGADGSGGPGGKDILGESAEDVSEAIDEVTEMGSLGFLTADEVRSIANFLGGGSQDDDLETEEPYSLSVSPTLAVVGGRDGRSLVVEVRPPEGSEQSEDWQECRFSAVRFVEPSDDDYPRGMDLPDQAMVLAYTLRTMKEGATAVVMVDIPEDVRQPLVQKLTDGELKEMDMLVPEGNAVPITVTDGGNGDEDHLQNSVIVDPVVIGDAAGSSTGAVPASSGGGGGCAMSRDSDAADILWLLLPLALPYAVRRFVRK